jgi:hypothetical protein
MAWRTFAAWEDAGPPALFSAQFSSGRLDLAGSIRPGRGFRFVERIVNQLCRFLMSPQTTFLFPTYNYFLFIYVYLILPPLFSSLHFPIFIIVLYLPYLIFFSYFFYFNNS